VKAIGHGGIVSLQLCGPDAAGEGLLLDDVNFYKDDA
jgi:hypothetical protein